MKDRISLKIGKVTFKLAPMTYLHKQELAQCTRLVSGEEHFDLLLAQSIYIKYSLKEVDGLKLYDGSKYELEFEGDYLTDGCVSEILNIEEKEKFCTAAWQLLNGVKELTNPVTGKKLTGVKLEVIQGK